MNTSAGIHIDPQDPGLDPRDRLSMLEAAATAWSGLAWAGCMYALALTVTALSGCSMALPDVPYVDPQFPCPYANADMAVVAALTEQEHYRATGHDVGGYSQQVTIQCVPRLMEVEEGYASGLTLDRYTVRISVMGGDLDGIWPLEYTALSHELTHAILLASGTDGDPDHVTPKVWDVERKVRIRQYGEAEQGCCLDPLGK